MPKYRLLTIEELQSLEKEFIDYLVVNGVVAEDWLAMKANDLVQAEAIVATFSDVVFEAILRKAKYLEIRGASFIYAYQCTEQNLVLVAMEVPESSEVDFTNPSYLAQAMKTPPTSLSVYTTSKPYSKVRELELFDMLQAGCELTDDKMFKALCLVLAENKAC
jgi:hypothetical protein